MTHWQRCCRNYHFMLLFAASSSGKRQIERKKSKCLSSHTPIHKSYILNLKKKGNVQYMPTLVCLEKRWGEKSKLEETRKCKRVIWGKTWEVVHRWMGNVTTNPCSAFVEFVLEVEVHGKLSNVCMKCCLSEPSHLHPAPCGISQPAFNLTPDTGHY